MRALLVLLLAALTLGGCASSGGSSGPGRSSDLIRSQEFREIESTTPNLYEAIQRLRPLWLRSRSTSVRGEQARPIVYVSGARYGELRALREIRTSSVRRARFMDASTATTRFGTGHVGGAILITLFGGP